MGSKTVFRYCFLTSIQRLRMGRQPGGSDPVCLCTNGIYPLTGYPKRLSAIQLLYRFATVICLNSAMSSVDLPLPQVIRRTASRVRSSIIPSGRTKACYRVTSRTGHAMTPKFRSIPGYARNGTITLGRHRSNSIPARSRRSAILAASGLPGLVSPTATCRTWCCLAIATRRSGPCSMLDQTDDRSKSTHYLNWQCMALGPSNHGVDVN